MWTPFPSQHISKRVERSIHEQIFKEWKCVHLKINAFNKFQGDSFGWELGEEPEQNPILRKQNKAKNKQAKHTILDRQGITGGYLS